MSRFVIVSSKSKLLSTSYNSLKLSRENLRVGLMVEEGPVLHEPKAGGGSLNVIMPVSLSDYILLGAGRIRGV